MASLFRPTYTDKKTGRRRKLKRWYVKYRDADGIVRRVKGYPDKEATRQLAARLERDAARRQEGMVDPFETHHKRPLLEHVADYRRHLLAKGDTDKHARQTARYVEAVLRGCKFVFVPDLSASAVGEFLHGLRLDPARPVLPAGQEWFTKKEVLALLDVHPNGFSLLLRRAGLYGTAQGNGKRRRYPRATVEALLDRLCRGRGASTSNAYLTAVKGFTRWLAKDRRTGSDPLTVLSRLNANADVRRERRALPAEDLQSLLEAAAASAAVFRGLAGPDRSMLYAVGMTTGFRAGELASLEPGSFALDGEPPTATVKASYSKNRRTSCQPLPPDVALALRGYLDGKPAGVPVWPGNWADDAADMLRIDLEAAGIPFADAEGRVCDFHALRHSYITLLQRSGVHPKVAQELARHSDIRLTMNVYTHAHLHDLAGAVEGLPSLLPSGRTPEAAALKATGTDGRHCPQHCPGIDSVRDSLRAVEAPRGEEEEEVGCRNSGSASVLESDCERVRGDEETAPCRTRTYNPLIKSQLLCQLS
jgi:integrase